MQTANGVGTRFYGKSDVHTDKSYITTKWVVCLWLPILPLGSYRVWPEMASAQMPGETVMMRDYENVEYNLTSVKRRYKVQKVNWHWKQIGKTYLFGLIGFIVFL